MFLSLLNWMRRISVIEKIWFGEGYKKIFAGRVGGGDLIFNRGEKI